MTKSIYNSLDDEILFMIQTADGFIANDHKPSTFHATSFYRYDTALLDELLILQKEQDEDKFAIFALLLETKIS